MWWMIFGGSYIGLNISLRYLSQELVKFRLLNASSLPITLSLLKLKVMSWLFSLSMSSQKETRKLSGLVNSIASISESYLMTDLSLIAILGSRARMQWHWSESIRNRSCFDLVKYMRKMVASCLSSYRILWRVWSTPLSIRRLFICSNKSIFIQNRFIIIVIWVNSPKKVIYPLILEAFKLTVYFGLKQAKRFK